MAAEFWNKPMAISMMDNGQMELRAVGACILMQLHVFYTVESGVMVARRAKASWNYPKKNITSELLWSQSRKASECKFS